MSEHQESGAPEYSHITQEDMDKAAEITAKIDALGDQTSNKPYRELISDPSYEAVNKMQTEAHDTNFLVDLGTEKFGLDRQEVANSEQLLQALYEVSDLEEEKKYFATETEKQITALKNDLARKHQALDQHLVLAEAKVKEVAGQTEKTE